MQRKRPPEFFRGILRWTIIWSILAICSLVFFFATTLSLLVFNDLLFSGISRFWGRTTLKILGIKPVIKNQAVLSGTRPRVVIFNHQSAIDMLWLACILPMSTTVLIKKEYKYLPFLNLALWLAGFIFVDRSDKKKAIKSIKPLPKLILKDHKSLFIAPEGTRTPDGNFLPFKKGAFRIALEGKIPIYPVVVKGAYDLLPKDGFCPQEGIISIACLNPIDTSDWKLETLEQHISEVRNIMIKKYSEM